MESFKSGLNWPGLPVGLLAALQLAASDAGLKRLAVVGGAVRDGLLHHQHLEPWRELPDLDLVVEGSATALVESLCRQLASGRLTKCLVHEAYDTVELILDGVLIDLASARKETYAGPGHNPDVSDGSLEADLARRDFTVNAMALELPDGLLLDPYGGQAALERRQLAFLHPLSVSDDPTRVVRGARYVARLGLVLSPEALTQVQSTLLAWPWAWRPGQPPELAPPSLATRLRMELELLFEHEPWEMALGQLQDWGALQLLDHDLQTDQHWRRRLRWASRLGVPLLLALVAGSADSQNLAARLQLPKHQQMLLAESRQLQIALDSPLVRESWSSWSASRWCQFLEGQVWRSEAV
ncbi:MAG: CCA tRNA nucleotidyltransferase, partial [Prochlorococcus sp.]|nr:CCA tRNA nucleotidyltransferase [Prochlorococcus sp.]